MRLGTGKIIFLILVVFALGVTLVSGIIGTRLIGKPFIGFPLNEFFRIGVVGITDWTGVEAGLELGDRIVEINGKEITNIKQVHEIVNETELGTPITYTVLRGDELLTISVPTMRFRLSDLLITFVSPFVIGLILLLTGIIVYFMKPNTQVSWVFALLCFFLGLYFIPAFDISLTHFGFVRFLIFALSFVSACFIHLSLIFPESTKIIQKYPYVQWCPYVLSFILFLALELAYPGDVYWRLMDIAIIYLLAGAIAIVVKALYDFLKAVSTIRRERAKVILLGASIAFPIPAFLYLSPFIFPSLYKVPGFMLAVPILVFPASIAYSIVRHNLFDVDVIVKRTVGYVLVTGVIIALYGLTTIIFNVFFGRYKIVESKVFPIIFTLVVILIFNPLRNRIQSVVDTVFFRKEYDYRETVEKISEAMRSLMDLDQIVNRIIGMVMGAMFLDSGSVVLLDRKMVAYQLCAAGGERWHKQEKTGVQFAVDDPLIRSIAETKMETTIYDIQEDPRYRQEREKCLETFNTLQASLLIPLVYEDQLSGLVALGDKKSGKFYTREDINLVRTLANQSAVAIENARLFQENLEKQRMEEELAIARDLQTSMLPAACPEIEGFEIAATSIPAREVGGDFFDFIEMGEGRLGLVIGDVTGKSVSGALVMSASRSVFRMLSEENLTVGEIMFRANRRTKKDIKSGMFVALLYAVLNAKDRTLSLCSAGQTQPIYLSAETGQASLVETVGDTFPLGILKDADYQETKLQMAPGDKVIFYTDGIVEEMNEEKEIFGFERLLEVPQETQSMNADSLLKEIIGRVSAFAGGVAQHDDLTVIVLSVGE
jgi:sigma-B regulation protein RsbU (phosphoserine phosphatase)